MEGSDPRWRALAEVLVGHATAVRQGDRVLVAMREPETFPLAVRIHEAVIRAGGFPQTIVSSAGFERSLLQAGSPEQIAWEPELETLAVDWADVSIWLRGSRNPAELAGIPAERLASHRAAMGAISARRTERTRWTLTRIPGEPMAQAAGLPLDELTERYFAACLIDWVAAGAEWGRFAARLEAGSEVRISGPGTNLAFSTLGRRWLVGDGRINIPDGEVYTAPTDDSMDGAITFDWPQVYAGHSFEGVRLRFQRGVVVEATAARNEEHLRAVLAVDDGARRVGEVGFGVNHALSSPVADPLWDEKIFGTMHLALGRAYAECGGVNRSAIHWDLVRDLRRGGTIEVDGVPIFADGGFIAESTG